MFDSIYGPRILEVLEDIYALLSSLSSVILTLSINVERILLSLVFFGLLFVAYNFISKRWLTLNA